VEHLSQLLAPCLAADLGRARRRSGGKQAKNERKSDPVEVI
jgi:hypothetical protein